MVSQQFSSTAFAGTTLVLQSNTLERCGGLFVGTQHGALELYLVDRLPDGLPLQ